MISWIHPLFAMLLLLALPAAAAHAGAERAVARGGAHTDVHGTAHGRSMHLALLLGGSNVQGEGRHGGTFGVDLEYELTHRIGVGAVIEHAGDEVDSTTALAVVDWHIFPGFVFQFGPGVEYEREREVEHEPGHGTIVRSRTEPSLVGRVGFFYEYELGNEWSIAPSVNLDVTSRHETLVWGLAIGRRFR